MLLLLEVKHFRTLVRTHGMCGFLLVFWEGACSAGTEAHLPKKGGTGKMQGTGLGLSRKGNQCLCCAV